MKRYLAGIALFLTLLTGVFSVIGIGSTIAQTTDTQYEKDKAEYNYYCLDRNPSVDYEKFGFESEKEMTRYCVYLKASIADDENQMTAARVVDIGDERITKYHSDISILPDSSMQVTENITLISRGFTIRHGIYRDFPTTYRDSNGNKIVVAFTVTDVKRDGNTEPYSIERMSNGKRIRIGSADVILPPGTYTYTITYTTNRQLGYFTDHDELYWNVTGNGWQYAIEEASATVTLPAGVPVDSVKTNGYTGAMGSKDQNYTATIHDQSIDFATTQPLNAEEGLTIAVSWQKGFVHEPTEKEQWDYFLKDNWGLLVAILLVIVLFIYHFISWFIYGRDPKPQTIVAQYESPRELSPAQVHYQNAMGYTKKAFTAAILNMAVKGYVTISDSDGEYTLKKTGKNVPLSKDEQAIATIVFQDRESIVLSQSNYQILQLGETSVKSILKDSLGEMIVTNGRKIFIGVIISIIILVIGSIFVLPAVGIDELIFMVIWLGIWNFVSGMILVQSIRMLKSNKAQASMMLVFILLFMIIPDASIFFSMGDSVPINFVIYAIFVIAISLIFLPFMKRRTVEGRKLQDEIEGFKLFLSVTEKDRMNFHNPPEKTPELFEKFLPYALALGVEQQWAEQFAAVFAALTQPGQTHYSPAWYSGTAFSAANIGVFGSSFGSSFNSAISASSTPPGSSGGGSSSSSGFSSSSSSGGGGGGGGGGGW